MAYRITADIRFVTGSIAGISLPDGWTVTTPTTDGASHYADWLDDHHRNQTEVDGVGHRFLVTSFARVERE